MTTAAIRKELHHIIDIADSRQLKALYILLEHNNAPSSNYSEAELGKFYSLLNDYENGTMSGKDPVIAHAEIRAKIAAGR